MAYHPNWKPLGANGLPGLEIILLILILRAGGKYFAPCLQEDNDNTENNICRKKYINSSYGMGSTLTHLGSPSSQPR